MDLIISNASGKPIYDQIYTQNKNCILSGELSPGDALPSIRALARAAMWRSKIWSWCGKPI